MAGIKGRSGPPGNGNAFRHGLAAISDRRGNGTLTAEEQDIRQEILAGLITDKGGEQNTSTAMKVLAEVIATDAAWLVAFNKATDAVMAKNHKARSNPKALATLDGYKRGLVNSLTSNLHRFGLDKVERPAKTLAELLEEDETENGEG